MNAFWIKAIAISAMLVDHFALYFFPDSLPLQIIGRLSFPLIAWLIANGAIHTRNIDRYLLRLGIFALIAQIPFEIGFRLAGNHPLFLNILFTLFFGLASIRAMQSTSSYWLKGAAVAGFALLAAILHADYGAGGVLSIAAFYIWWGKPIPTVLSQVFILAILTKLDFFIAPGFAPWLFMHPLEQYGLLALPIILAYNGRRGPATGLLFYWFFVAQEFLLLVLKVAIHR